MERLLTFQDATCRFWHFVLHRPNLTLLYSHLDGLLLGVATPRHTASLVSVIARGIGKGFMRRTVLPLGVLGNAVSIAQR